MKVNDSDDPDHVVLFGSGGGFNCYYWAAGYKQGAGDWVDWSPTIWDIPTSGNFTKENPCLPKLQCFK